MQHVTAKYGDATVHDYQQAKALLLRPYVIGTDIDIFLASHVEAHHTCIRTGNALNDIEKVNALITAVGGTTGPFNFTISKYEEDTGSNIAYRLYEDLPASNGNPAREGLATRIRKAARRIPEDTGNATPRTGEYYSAAAISTPAPPNIREEVIRALQEVLPSMLATALGGTPPTTSTTPHRDCANQP